MKSIKYKFFGVHYLFKTLPHTFISFIMIYIWMKQRVFLTQMYQNHKSLYLWWLAMGSCAACQSIFNTISKYCFYRIYLSRWIEVAFEVSLRSLTDDERIPMANPTWENSYKFLLNCPRFTVMWLLIEEISVLYEWIKFKNAVYCWCFTCC